MTCIQKMMNVKVALRAKVVGATFLLTLFGTQAFTPSHICRNLKSVNSVYLKHFIDVIVRIY